MENSTLLLIVLGGLGGLIPDILRLIKIGRAGRNVPKFLSKLMFWISVVLLMLLGAFVSWLLGANDYKEAVAYGFAAPELITRLVASPTEADRGEIRGDTKGLLNWWST